MARGSGKPQRILRRNRRPLPTLGPAPVGAPQPTGQLFGREYADKHRGQSFRVGHGTYSTGTVLLPPAQLIGKSRPQIQVGGFAPRGLAGLDQALLLEPERCVFQFEDGAVCLVELAAAGADACCSCGRGRRCPHALASVYLTAGLATGPAGWMEPQRLEQHRQRLRAWLAERGNAERLFVACETGYLLLKGQPEAGLAPSYVDLDSPRAHAGLQEFLAGYEQQLAEAGPAAAGGDAPAARTSVRRLLRD